MKQSLIATIAAILSLAGMIAMSISLFYRRGDAPPVGSREPGDKKPLWKQQDRFRGPGFRLLFFGWLALVVGQVVWSAIQLWGR